MNISSVSFQVIQQALKSIQFYLRFKKQQQQQPKKVSFINTRTKHWLWVL